MTPLSSYVVLTSFLKRERDNIHKKRILVKGVCLMVDDVYKT